MAKRPFDLNISLLAPEDTLRYFRGQTLVGCLKHEQLVMQPLREGWSCPICGFAPPEAADRAALIVKSIDHRTGTIVVG